MTNKSPHQRALVLLFLIACGFIWSISFARPGSQEAYKTKNPHGNLTMPCENCHSTDSWRPMRPSPIFDHRSTRYPLQGMSSGSSTGFDFPRPIG